MPNEEDFTQNERVFACNMGAIEPAQRAEHLANTRQLLGKLQSIEERPDGYALQIPLDATTLLDAVRFINLERLCCPFFGFTVEVEPGASSFWLGLAGPAGVKPFIEAELELSYPA